MHSCALATNHSQGQRYKLTYDGMYHFDIPKTRQYDTGKIEVIARSSVGEAHASCELKITPRRDDYRGVLKNSPRRKYTHGHGHARIHQVIVLFLLASRHDTERSFVVI